MFRKLVKAMTKPSIPYPVYTRDKLEFLPDAFVLCVDCNGCMANDYKLRWLGQVSGIIETPNWKGLAAEVAIIKDDYIPGDIRDEDYPHNRVFISVDDSSFQLIVPGLFIWYR